MRGGDFLSFINKERQRLISYVRSLLKETAALDAEDVVHDVLLKLLEKADLIVPEDNLAAYVYRSLKNRVIDHSRTQKPTVSLDEGPDEHGGKLVDVLHDDFRPDGLEVLQTQRGREQLFEALQVLGEMERKVIIAHEFEGISFKELSRQWQVPQNTLLSHKARGLKKLRARLAGF